MKRLLLLFSVILFVLSGNGLRAQTNPVPFYLNSGNYFFNTWITTNPAGTYPTAGRFHRTGVNVPLLAEPTTVDYTGAYTNAGTAARIEGTSGSNGFIFNNLNTSADNNLGAFVLGMNSVGRIADSVSFFAAYSGIGDSVAVRLQYRTNTCGSWLDVPGPVEFVVPKNAAPVPSSVTLGPISLTALGLDNKPNYQLRWKYYYLYSYSGSISGAKIRISNITVKSTAAAGNYLVTDCVAGGYCVTATTSAAASVPFGYCSSTGAFVSGTTVFTAQLSDASGSFASPVTLGSVTCNGSGYQTIAGVIPANTTTGAAYRIRVISSAPSLTGTDNGTNFSIQLAPLDVTSPALNCGYANSTVTWTLPASCYDEVMVVASLSSTSTLPAGNGSAYTSNATYGSGTAFGGGFVVYKGTGSNVIVSNLAIGTTYYFKIWIRYGTTWSPGVELYCAPDPGTFAKVVISAYYNSVNVPDEWTELLVLGDDVDMRGWTIRDNNNNQNAWQTPVTFNSIPFWQHMRRGTIIMLWHRTNDLFGVPHPTDANKSDGYIEVDCFNATYFNGANLSNSMNLAAPMDLVQIRDASSVHVHAMGHGAVPVDWTPLPAPKLNHASAINDGEAVYVCPGGSVTAYDGPSGTTLTTRNSATLTFGLPNTCTAGPSTNATFWALMREPYMAAQTITPSTIIAGAPGSVTFSWNSAIDPYPADNTTGYLILRNTSNSFTAPGDGTTYTTGSLIGGATIVGQITNSTITSFTDNTVMNGSTYYYRVYAFRFDTDNTMGNSFDANRGRAYNTNNFVSVNWPTSSPLPVTMINFNAVPEGEKVKLLWSTASEIQNDYFLLEKSTDGRQFSFLGKVKGAGTSHSVLNYRLDDIYPSQGINYYSLIQVDFDGTRSARKIIAVNMNESNSIPASVYPNPFTGDLQVDLPQVQTGLMVMNLYNCLGMKVIEAEHAVSEGYNHFSIPASQLANGMYFLELIQGNVHSRLTVIKQ